MGREYMERVGKSKDMIEFPADLKGRTIYIAATGPGAFKLADPIEDTPTLVLKRLAVMESLKKDYNCDFEIIDMSSLGYQGQATTEWFTLQKAGGTLDADWYSGFQLNNSPGTKLFSDFFYPSEDIAPIKNQPEGTWLNWTYLPEAHKYNGKNYGVSDTNSLWSFVDTFLLFNKDMFEQYGLEDPYQLVRDKAWTFEKFSEMANKVFDQSGGTIKTMAGTWGGAPTFRQFMTANGAPPFEYVNGKIATNINTDKGYYAMQFVQDFFVKGMTSGGLFGEAMRSTFYGGEYLFYIGESGETRMAVAAPFDVGILPMPIGPDATDYAHYISVVGAWEFINNGKNIDESGAVFTAYVKRMNHFYPDFDTDYEVVPWQDGIGVNFDFDDDAMEMIDIISTHVVMDQTNMMITFGDANNMFNSLSGAGYTPKEVVDMFINVIQQNLDDLNKDLN